jgi:hypothetical protein
MLAITMSSYYVGHGWVGLFKLIGMGGSVRVPTYKGPTKKEFWDQPKRFHYSKNKKNDKNNKLYIQIVVIFL